MVRWKAARRGPDPAQGGVPPRHGASRSARQPPSAV